MEKTALWMIKSIRTIWVEYDVCGSEEECLQDFVGSLQERDHFEDVDVDGI